MRPRTTYRATLIVLAFAAVLAVVGAATGNWLPVVAMLLAGVSGVLNLRAMRRRGIGWNGPTTFRELRERKGATDD